MGIIKNLADEDHIRISWYIKKTDLLGPFLRSVLWVQGCSRNCPGCIAEHTHSPEGGKDVLISKIANRFIAETSTEGMTITGGEPFLQADKLCRLIGEIKESRPDYGVIIYTGFSYEELTSSSEDKVRELLGMTDILIDGPYVEELDDNKGLRGSSNQRVIPLTERYSDQMSLYTNLTGRRNSMVVKDAAFRMIGIPSGVSKEIMKELGII
jgi:anaerobic ribonucleoside-triphosphate reductase activating protein